MPDVLEEAAEELVQAVEFYESREPGLGRRFRRVVGEAFVRIDEMPEVWPPYLAEGAPAGARHFLLRPFRESVVYMVEEPPLVVAIAHGRRTPW